MRFSSFKHTARAGFSRTDLLALLAVVTMLGTFGAISLANTRAETRLQTCTSNLRQIAAGLGKLAQDREGRLPGTTQHPEGNFWWWYKEDVKPYLGLRGPASPDDTLFACPSDRGYSDPRPFSQTPRFAFNSYVFNGVTLFNAPNIAGWKISQVRQPDHTLLLMEWSAHAPLSWHRSRTGKKNTPFYKDAESVVAFVDGSVRLNKMYYDGYNAAYLRDPIPGYNYKFSGN